MSQISSTFGDRARLGFIQGEDVLTTLNTTVMRSLNWPLPAITVTKKEYTFITEPAINNVLSKLKIVNTIKGKVINGPLHLQGMGMKNLYTLLGAIHITTIVHFYDKDTD